MNRTMPRHARQRRQRRGADQHGKMAFPRTIIPTMSGVLCAFVHNFKPLWGKGRDQPQFHFV
jgi:hypothetical protein